MTTDELLDALLDMEMRGVVGEVKLGKAWAEPGPRLVYTVCLFGVKIGWRYFNSSTLGGALAAALEWARERNGFEEANET